jgi:hypothetical protein
MSAQYTVKLDVNGYVNGFGLWNSGSNGAFYVNANTFYLGAGGVTPGAPFVATQTGATINGKYYPPGVWMLTAFIHDATIDFAKISDTIQSTNFQWASTGWKIYKDGYAQFSNIWARGDIEASSIKAGSANIINTLMLQSNSVTLSKVMRGTWGYSPWNMAWNSIFVPNEAVGQPIIILAWCGEEGNTPNAPYGQFAVSVGAHIEGGGTILDIQSLGAVMVYPPGMGDNQPAYYSLQSGTITTFLTTTYGGWYNIFLNHQQNSAGWGPYTAKPRSALILYLGQR